MTMLERAACAVVEGPGAGLPIKPYADLTPEAKAFYERVVRAVLLAIREPDEGMIAAGIDDRSRGEGSIQSIFRAMIDHILAEKGEG